MEARACTAVRNAPRRGVFRHPVDVAMRSSVVHSRHTDADRSPPHCRVFLPPPRDRDSPGCKEVWHGTRCPACIGCSPPGRSVRGRPKVDRNRPHKHRSYTNIGVTPSLVLCGGAAELWRWGGPGSVSPALDLRIRLRLNTWCRWHRRSSKSDSGLGQHLCDTSPIGRRAHSSDIPCTAKRHLGVAPTQHCDSSRAGSYPWDSGGARAHARWLRPKVLPLGVLLSA